MEKKVNKFVEVNVLITVKFDSKRRQSKHPIWLCGHRDSDENDSDWGKEFYPLEEYLVHHDVMYTQA